MNEISFFAMHHITTAAAAAAVAAVAVAVLLLLCCCAAPLGPAPATTGRARTRMPPQALAAPV